MVWNSKPYSVAFSRQSGRSFRVTRLMVRLATHTAARYGAGAAALHGCVLFGHRLAEAATGDGRGGRGLGRHGRWRYVHAASTGSQAVITAAGVNELAVGRAIWRARAK